jgi:lipopolysaccharide export system protein LptA
MFRSRGGQRSTRFLAQAGARGLAAVTLAIAITGLACAADSKSSDQTPINIVATKLDYFDKAAKLIYTGNVVATRGDTVLKTPKLTVYLAPRQHGPNAQKSSSSDRVKRMEAAGPVTLISNDQVATGDSGIYEKSADKVYLDGNVSLTQGPNVTLGDHIVYDVKTTQAIVTGHVRSLFIPDSDNNKNQGGATNGGAAPPRRSHKASAGRSQSAAQ